MKNCGSKREKLYCHLQQAILQGKYQHGLQLPSEPVLSQQFQVARETLRYVLKKLEMEGLLLRTRPKGTFVNFPPAQNKGDTLIALIHPGNDIAEPRNYILPGIQSAAIENDLKVEVYPVDILEIPENTQIFSNKNIKGFIIFDGCYNGEEPYIRKLQNAKVPVVMAACHPGDGKTTGFAGVTINRRQAWIDAILALKKIGHRRIATLSASTLQGFHTDYEAYYAFLKEEDIFYPELICYCDYEYDAIKRKLAYLMSLDKPPTVIMCYSDFYALKLLNAAHELHLQIPGVCSVMGYSGYAGGKLLDTPLATVDFKYFDIGRKCVNILLKEGLWFEQKEIDPPYIIMPHEVILRESAALN